MSPLQATVKFYESYQQCFQRKSRATVDIREVPFKTGVSSNGLLKSGRQFTSFWRARQFADRLGVPYDVFFEYSMELLMRAGWERLPHINQLTAGKHRPRIAAAVKTGWQEHLDNFLMISEAPQYTVPSFIGLHSQKDHRDWIIAEMKRVHGQPWRIADVWLTRQLFSESCVKHAWDEERLTRAREQFSGALPPTVAKSNIWDVLPSCLGLPGAFDASTHCSDCKFKRFCAVLADMALEGVEEQTGSVDQRLPKGKKRAETAQELAAQGPRLSGPRRHPLLQLLSASVRGVDLPQGCLEGIGETFNALQRE